MIDSVLSLLGRSIASAVLLFEKTVIAMDAFDIVTIAIILGIVGRRLLKPIFGGGSDTAKKVKPTNQKGDGE